jgi:hypothetical protein
VPDSADCHENDNRDQDGAENANAAVTEAVSIAAESAAKAADQENDENDNQNESYRHTSFLWLVSV